MTQNKHQGSGWRGGAARFAGVMAAGALTLAGQGLSSQPVPNVVQWGVIASPVPPDVTNVVAASICDGSAAAIRADGSLAVWGAFAGAPNLPSGLTSAVAVASGGEFGMAVTNGVVVLWGGSQGGPIFPVPPDLTNVVGVACANAPIVLRSDYTAAWWYQYETVATNAVAIAGGEYSGLALQPDGTVAPWGFDACGHGMMNIPPGLTNAVGVAAGVCFYAALKADGTVIAWGDNTYGQTNVPPDLTNAVAIAAGALHCLALRADGTVVEWGQNPYEHPGTSSGPTNFVASLSNVVSIAAGGYSSLAVTGTRMPPSQVVVANVAFRTGGFSAQVPTDRGRVYALEYKNSVTDAQWTLLPLVAGTGGAVTLSDAAPGPGQRFYRVRRW